VQGFFAPVAANTRLCGARSAARLWSSTNALSAALKGLIKPEDAMANVIITLKIMPESPEIDLKKLEKQAKDKIAKFSGETETKTEIEPIAFGLKALKIIFVMNEAKGSTEEMEKAISGIEGVSSVEVVDVRRAVG